MTGGSGGAATGSWSRGGGGGGKSSASSATVPRARAAPRDRLVGPRMAFHNTAGAHSSSSSSTSARPDSGFLVPARTAATLDSAMARSRRAWADAANAAFRALIPVAVGAAVAGRLRFAVLIRGGVCACARADYWKRVVEHAGCAVPVCVPRAPHHACSQTE